MCILFITHLSLRQKEKIEDFLQIFNLSCFLFNTVFVYFSFRKSRNVIGRSSPISLNFCLSRLSHLRDGQSVPVRIFDEGDGPDIPRTWLLAESFWFPKLPRKFPGARKSLLREPATEWNCTAEGHHFGFEHWTRYVVIGASRPVGRQPPVIRVRMCRPSLVIRTHSDSPATHVVQV